MRDIKKIIKEVELKLTLKNKIIRLLDVENGLSDREIADRILGEDSQQQAVNKACRQLCDKGIIKRTSPPIKNYICKEELDNRNKGLVKPIFSKLIDAEFYDRETVFKNKFNKFCLDEFEYKNLIDKIKNSKSNSNGYDVEFDGKVKIIAEIKCNNPVNNSSKFGSSQCDGILKDINYLIKGKSKSNLTDKNIQEYYKFMVMYDFGHNLHEAIENLLNKNRIKFKVEIYKDEIKLKTDVVYVVILSK